MQVIVHNVFDTLSNYSNVLNIRYVSYHENMYNWLVKIVALQLRCSMFYLLPYMFL